MPQHGVHAQPSLTSGPLQLPAKPLFKAAAGWRRDGICGGNGRLQRPLAAGLGDIIDVQVKLPPIPPPPEDKEKEESLKFRRTVFDFDRWRKHRSTSRYRRHMFGLIGSRIVRGLATPLRNMLILSAAVCAYESSREAGLLPADYPSISVGNTLPFNVSSFALSLLLVFRTNTSYGRWDEARKLWGSITNRSRDLVRQAEHWFPEAELDLLDIVQRWMAAFPHTLQAHLRSDGDTKAALQGILTETELEILVKADHRPNYVLSVMSCAIEEAHIPDAARIRLDTNLTSFADSLGACERILKTPIPLTYTRHTSRFLVVFLFFLPFTLWKACGWGTLPASITIAFLLLGIEEIGVQIEEPFSILPLEAISGTITKNVMEMHAKREEVRQLVRSQARPLHVDGNGPEKLELTTEPGRRERYYSPKFVAEGSQNGQQVASTKARRW